jgi:hypothetical protein
MFCKCLIKPISNLNSVYSHSKIVTAGVRSGSGLTRFIGLDMTDSLELRKMGAWLEEMKAV